MNNYHTPVVTQKMNENKAFENNHASSNNVFQKEEKPC